MSMQIHFTAHGVRVHEVGSAGRNWLMIRAAPLVGRVPPGPDVGVAAGAWSAGREHAPAAPGRRGSCRRRGPSNWGVHQGGSAAPLLNNAAGLVDGSNPDTYGEQPETTRHRGKLH